MFVTDQLHHLIMSGDDPFYIDHLCYIVYIINTKEPLEHTLESIN